MTLAEHIEYQPLVAADTGCLASVPPVAANDNVAASDSSHLPTWHHRYEPPVTDAMQAPWGIRPAVNFDHLPRVIALSGAAGSGKSTVSDFLAVRFGYRKTKFAAPLKDMCRALGMTEAMIEGDQKEVPQDWLGGKSPRYAMQHLGQSWGRDCMGEDFWVDQWERAATGRVVVDDTRYANEAARVRRMGGRVIRLTGRGGIAGGHVSEQVNFIADEVIENTGSIENLQGSVLEVLDGWRV